MYDSELSFVVAYFSTLFIGIFSIYLLHSIALMKLFDRAGEKGWKAWIPFVSSYTRTKIVFGEEHAFWFLIDFILGGIFGMYLAYNEAKAFGQTTVFAVLHMLFQPFTTLILCIQKPTYVGTQCFVLDQ